LRCQDFPCPNGTLRWLFLLGTVCLMFWSVPATVSAHQHGHHEHGHHEHDHPHPHDHGDAASGQPAPEMGQWGWTLIAGYSVLIVLASLLGGALPGRVSLTHTRMQHMISFVGGLMLGIGVFHLFPHAVLYLGSVDQSALWLMGGIVCMFFLLRAFHFHQHDFPAVNDAEIARSGEQGEAPLLTPHAHHHDSHAHGTCGHGPHSGQVHEMGWLGVFFGLGLHTLIDGLALGASIQAELGHASGIALCGLGTFAAIALHKPLDAISITSLMAAGGWSRTPQMVVNAVFAMLCPVGTVLFVIGTQTLFGAQEVVIGAALAFAAGVFICISLSDLLPEMEFHSHHRKTLTIALLLGIALAWSLRFLEPAHVHGG
jgi:zinc and cadmium transporter